MKAILKACVSIALLSACAAVDLPNGNGKVSSGLSLVDKVQKAVVETQKATMMSLPDEIAGLKAVESVADREKNQRGAGFTRVYANDAVMATVFVYNNQNFGVSAQADEEMEALMDKHLQEFVSLQDSGLYSDVEIGKRKIREFRWSSVKYQVLENDVSFLQKEEPKKSLLVLGANEDLMSYVRIRYTYPKSKRSELNAKHATFTRTVMVALRKFAAAQKESELH